MGPPNRLWVPYHAKYARISAAVATLAQVTMLQPQVCKPSPLSGQRLLVRRASHTISGLGIGLHRNG